MRKEGACSSVEAAITYDAGPPPPYVFIRSVLLKIIALEIPSEISA